MLRILDSASAGDLSCPGDTSSYQYVKYTPKWALSSQAGCLLVDRAAPWTLPLFYRYPVWPQGPISVPETGVSPWLWEGVLRRPR